jgi:putative sterol carrier protein
MDMNVDELAVFYSSQLEAFGQLAATLKFDFGDDALFIDGTVTPAIIRRSNEKADCTVKTIPATLTRIINREISGFDAYSTGKLRLEGAAAIALKFVALGKLVRPVRCRSLPCYCVYFVEGLTPR